MANRSSKRHQEQVTELGQHLGRELATKTVLFHTALAGRLGLSATDLKCLDLLRDNPAPLTATNLVELTGLTGGAITGVADRLEGAGFVERVRDPHDRRRWELHPLPHREAEIASLFAPLAASMAALCEAYSSDDLGVVIDFLTKLGAVMDTQTSRLRQ